MTRPRNWCRALLATMVAAANLAGAQPNACPQPLATVTVPEGTYAVVDGASFDGRVFLYVPEITARSGSFVPFDAWVVEGVYGRPFVQSRGTLSPAGFNRLKGNRNVRATAVRVAAGGTAGRVTIDRQTYTLVFDVRLASRDAVRVALCRAGR